jgi:hypothetical protein
MPSYRFEVLVQGKWYDNKVFFATHAEADRAGNNKFFNWTQCDEYRVVESDQPVNYRWSPEEGMIHIATSD